MSKKQLGGMIAGGAALLVGGIAVFRITDNAGGFVLMIAGCFLLAVSFVVSREK